MAFETKEEILKLGVIDPEFKALIESIDLPVIDYNDLDTFIKNANQDQLQRRKLLGEPPQSVKQSETTYTTEDGTKLRAKIYQPTNPPSAGSPLILLFHGGGFCIGSPEGEEQTARNMTHAFGAVCISAQYRLAPEFKFPHAINDAWDALKWTAANATSFGADPSLGFLIGGTSAGGNITASLALLARDNALTPPITGQWLGVPAVVGDNKMPEKYMAKYLSREQNKDAPVLPNDLIDLFMSGYQPDPNNVLFSLINHPKGHNDLPPTFFQIDGLDPLRDDGLIYESILREECGIKTRLVVYPGLPHAHWALFPMLKSSTVFRKDQVDGFGWLLGKEPNFEGLDLQAKATTA